MKDLKHIYYFEKLLEEANNDLVKQAVAEGNQALGYTCYYIPDVLLNLDHSFSVRLRAPKTGSMDISTYYMTNMLCGYSKAILERGIEGGYNFLSAFLAAETCAEMNRSAEHFDLLKLIPNDDFFVTFVDAPLRISEHGIVHYANQIRHKILEPLNKTYGIDISDDSIRRAVAEHNELCSIINEIGEFRKGKDVRITGTEFHILQLISSCCPRALVMDKLRETLEEIKTRQPDAKTHYRARVVIVGSEIDDPEFVRLVEDNGALVVADRFCFGSKPGREPIILNDQDDVLTQVATHYLETSQCARFMSKEKVKGRRDYVKQLVEDYHADGVIYEQLKFCEFWGYERALASYEMVNEYGVPAVSVDRQYTMSGSGQLRTRVQAFVESIEFKKLQNQQRGEDRG